MLSEECKKELIEAARKSYGVLPILSKAVIEIFEPILDKHFKKSHNTVPMFVTYKNRQPNPGPFMVVAVNWETKKMEVSNGHVRLYPTLDEVDYVQL